VRQTTTAIEYRDFAMRAESSGGTRALINASSPNAGESTFLQALISLAGAAGLALLVPFVILLVGLPVALFFRGLIEVIGWVLGISMR
jgi:hypothetical protein